MSNWFEKAPGQNQERGGKVEKLKKTVKCYVCNGSGKKDGKTCSDCNGSGKVDIYVS